MPIKNIIKNHQKVEKVDLVIKGGTIITMNPLHPFVEAIIIGDGKIIAAGPSTIVDKINTSGIRTINLDGKTLIPGLIQTNANSAWLGYYLENINYQIKSTDTLNFILNRVKKQTDKTSPGKWVKGYIYNESLFNSRQYLNRYVLDRISNRHPIFIKHFSQDLIVVNSYVLNLMNFIKNATYLNDMTIKKDDSGVPTGIINGRLAIYSLFKFLYKPSSRDVQNWIEKADELYLSYGITSVHDASLGSINSLSLKEVHDYLKHIKNNKIFTRVLTYIHYPFWKKMTQDDLCFLKSNYFQYNEKDFNIGGVKLLQKKESPDFFETTCNYNKQEVQRNLKISQDEFNRRVLEVHKAGYQISTDNHNNYNSSFITQAYTAALTDFPKQDPRHRIENFHLSNRKQMDLIQKKKILPTFSTSSNSHASTYQKSVWNNIYNEQVKFINLLYKKEIPFGIWTSPSDILNNKYTNIFSSLARHNLPILSIIKAMTINAAYIGFEETIKGSIEPGKLADFVVLSDNPLNCNLKSLLNIKVEMTIINGKVVYINM